MGTILVIFIILFVIGAAFTPQSDDDQTQTRYTKPRQMSRGERKRIEKAKRKAKEDAYEDFLMYYEVFHEDDWC